MINVLQSLPVVPFDLGRMLFGTEPALFYLEIAVRTGIVYGYTLLLVRWIGSRSLAQLSIVEFLLVVALGSAVGDPLFYPEVPLLHAILAITLVVLINKLIDHVLLRSRRAQRILDGVPVEVIREARIRVDQAARRNTAPAEIFEQLRLRGIHNLGEVEVAYIEPNGEISLFRKVPPVPGLPIVPPPELKLPGACAEAGTRTCCSGCGFVTESRVCECPFCGGHHWLPARMPGTLSVSDRCADDG